MIDIAHMRHDPSTDMPFIIDPKSVCVVLYSAPIISYTSSQTEVHSLVSLYLTFFWLDCRLCIR